MVSVTDFPAISTPASLAPLAEMLATVQQSENDVATAAGEYLTELVGQCQDTAEACLQEIMKSIGVLSGLTAEAAVQTSGAVQASLAKQVQIANMVVQTVTAELPWQLRQTPPDMPLGIKGVGPAPAPITAPTQSAPSQPAAAYPDQVYCSVYDWGIAAGVSNPTWQQMAALGTLYPGPQPVLDASGQPMLPAMPAGNCCAGFWLKTGSQINPQLTSNTIFPYCGAPAPTTTTTQPPAVAVTPLVPPVQLTAVSTGSGVPPATTPVSTPAPVAPPIAVPTAPACPPPVVNLSCPPPTVTVNPPAQTAGGVPPNITLIASDQAYLDSQQGQDTDARMDSLIGDAWAIVTGEGGMKGAVQSWWDMISEGLD